MRLAPDARVAVIGAGPGGLTAAKHLLEAGFDVSVFEASDDVGGQWNWQAPHSGIWPGLHTNTSRAMTAFSDFPAPADHPLHPAATQIHAYLRAYADHHGVTPHIRFATRVERVSPGWSVDGEPFAGVVIASGRFRAPVIPPGLEAFGGELLHAFDYPGAEPFRDRRVLVYGNGVSGVEVAVDLTPVARVIAAFRKPRYVIEKVVDGISSDWQWYTRYGALERQLLPREELSRRLRERVLGVIGDPAPNGAPQPDPDILVAGLALGQGWLGHVAAGGITCRPGVATVQGRTLRFTDGTAETVDAIVCATGYGLDIPYLDRDVWSVLGAELQLHHRTMHPDLPGLGFVGMFALQGPYFPILELQARWIAGTFAGLKPARIGAAERPPPIDMHHVLATTIAEASGVAPDPLAHPELSEPLLFGPLLPPRYRLQGPGRTPDAAARFAEQLAASPRPPVDPADVEALRRFGLGELADRMPQPAVST